MSSHKLGGEEAQTRHLQGWRLKDLALGGWKVWEGPS